MLIAAGADVNAIGQMPYLPRVNPLGFIAQELNGYKDFPVIADTRRKHYQDIYILLRESGGKPNKPNKYTAILDKKIIINKAATKAAFIYNVLTAGKSFPKEVARYIASGIIAVKVKDNLENPLQTKKFAIEHLLKNDSKNVKEFAQKQIEPQSNHVDKAKEEKSKKGFSKREK